jgi:hypothetical protein
MARKRTFASVTDTPCSCGYLERSASDPNTPIQFNGNLNEYYIEHEVAKGAKVRTLIYHCPFCGGMAPESRREKLFATVPPEETRRLDDLVRELKTVEDFLRVLGAPDADPPFRAPEYLVGDASLPLRVLVFSQVSKVADVQVGVYSNNEVRVSFLGKYLGTSSP